MMPEQELAIVTSCHNYGQYLGDWTTSLLNLRRRPALVGLVENGSTDRSRSHVRAAAARLSEAGLIVRTQLLDQAVDFGTARNLAVRLAGAVPWVMHLDADDMLMPHALEDVAELAPTADVVALGYERCGDLQTGPRNRTKVYKSSTGPEVLRSTAPASGVSPFRRALWEQRPYRTDMIGGWDTALWLGFGHLGARIRPTRRACFWYRQHADSVFNVRRLSTWPATRTGTRLNGVRAGWDGVTVVVPRELERDAQRSEVWRWLRTRWAAAVPGWQILEGRAPARPWTKGAAIAAAIPEARGEVLVILDADCWLDPAALAHAVDLVRTGAAPWVVPHRLVHRYSREATARILALPPTAELLEPGERDRDKAAYEGFAGGGCVVVHRADYMAARGIPLRFSGWGAEDEALACILDTLLGPHVRLEADLRHLWHAPQVDRLRSVNYRTNRRQLAVYQQAAGDMERMWWLVSGRGEGHFTTNGAGGRWSVLARARALQDERGNEKEAPVTDRFALRRLARQAARNLAQEDPMGAGRDLKLVHRRKLAEQRQRNLKAVQEEEQRRQQAMALAGMPEVERRLAGRRAHKAAREEANKMIPGAPENKEGPTPAPPVILGARPVEVPADVMPDAHWFRGVPFDTLDAARLAAEGNMLPAVFSGRQPRGDNGFTLPQVRALGRLQQQEEAGA